MGQQLKSTTVEDIIDRVSGGENVEEVVDEISADSTELKITQSRSQKKNGVDSETKSTPEVPDDQKNEPESVAVCTGCNELQAAHKEMCDNCGSYLVEESADVEVKVTGKDLEGKTSHKISIEPTRPSEMAHGKREYKLSHLRPRDKFVFIDEAPFPDTDIITEYSIVPSKRGFVSFTADYEKIHSMTFSQGLLFPVKPLIDDEAASIKKIYAGDKVVNRHDGRKGVVINRSGNGYKVRLETDDSVVFMQGKKLQVVEKEKTTRNYIRTIGEDENKRWVVAFGDYERFHDTFVEALDDLRLANRTAFNRYSRMMAHKEGKVSAEVVDYLTENDPRIWKNAEVLSRKSPS